MYFQLLFLASLTKQNKILYMNKAVLCLHTFWTRQCTIPQTCRVFSVSSPLLSLSLSPRRPLPHPPMSVCWNPTPPEVWLKCHLSHRLPSTPLPLRHKTCLLIPHHLLMVFPYSSIVVLCMLLWPSLKAGGTWEGEINIFLIFLTQ